MFIKFVADGSANQALITNGSGVLSFAAVGASAGQVIQVLSATDATPRSSSSGSYVTASNTLSVTITPSSASNKILILLSTTVEIADTTYVTIFRGATNIGSANGFARCPTFQNIGINYLDSPNTTSATTYQLYFKVDTVNTTTIQPASITGSITCLEIKG